MSDPMPRRQEVNSVKAESGQAMSFNPYLIVATLCGAVVPIFLDNIRLLNPPIPLLIAVVAGLVALLVFLRAKDLKQMVISQKLINLMTIGLVVAIILTAAAAVLQ